ncbi:hypothetical protein FIBSPDRAFT_1049503 [Athelia psychrophila]|uniref:Zn(2)-C6 fungal-type domain-containing protein n=1 Tax=Athelia psychrophila TaxID=1759441 RepID=A0A166C3V4_9AGAM|nr:hypothetical protein FIBSPDRAFT_1049503 [Fibularhizoctonia sp. CBS 109695]
MLSISSRQPSDSPSATSSPPEQSPEQSQPAGEKQQRSRQVCTECRQKKLKCDARDTFPAPCSRCSRLRPRPICRVDPNFKRSRKRPLAPQASDANTSLAIPHISVLPPLPLAVPTGALNDLQLSEAIWPSSFYSGQAMISLDQAMALFDEFFTYFHPHCPIFLRRLEPVAIHRTDPLVFWAILGVASRKQAISPLARQVLDGISHTVIMTEIMSMVGNLMISPKRSLGTVQALVLLCEWQVPATEHMESRGWFYVGLAIQTALQVGVHRPHHSQDFALNATDERHRPESIEGQERTLAWIYCQIVAYNVASIQGLPSPAKDDYVTLEACAASSRTTPLWLADIPKQVLDSLRIARFTDRVAQALGGSSMAASGQLPGASTTSLFSLFSSELTELERNVNSGDLSTSVRLQMARIRLCAFELQTARTPSNMATRTVAAMDCYFNCMRLLETTCTTSIDEVARWPNSLSFGCFISCICLIRLLATEDGQALDMSAALTQISIFFRMSSEIIIDADELRLKMHLMISFCVREATHGQGNRFSDLFPNAESRMGISNWLWDTIVRARYSRDNLRALRDAQQHADFPLEAPHTEPAGNASSFAPAPDADFTMVTPMDFDEILASFSNGEWEVPSMDFIPTW